MPHRFPEDGKALDLLSGLENDFLLSVMNASQDCIKIVEVDGRLSFMNSNGMCALEIDDFSMVADQPWANMWPATMRSTLLQAMENARNGNRTSFEAACPTMKGTQKWWHVTVMPLHNAKGAVYRILASSRDVTERVLREQEQRAHTLALEIELAEKTALLDQRQFLLREIDHRVKNSLSQVAAILRMQARQSSPEVRGALDKAAQRVASIARVHEQLQTSDDFKSIPVVPLLDRLCAEFTTIFDTHVAFIVPGSEQLSMASDQASAICFIVSELVANAVRHGTGESPITVDFQKLDNTARIKVANAANGPRPVQGANTAGLGTLICETYAGTIGGDLDWHFADGRMTATLTFPSGA